jgi:hypothetical protein
MSKIESKQTKESMKQKVDFFEKINKIDKPLTNMGKHEGKDPN